MFLLAILSSTLFVVPVLVTFGVYFGVEHVKILKCGLYCKHTGEDVVDDPTRLVATEFCDKSRAISPPPGRYIYQWGDLDNTGFLCLNFITSGLDTSDKYAPAFTATWQYPQGSIDHPVHAFANADVNLTQILPVRISDMSALTMDVSWSYSVGNEEAETTDFDALSEAKVNANVALDLFLAADEQDALSTTESDYEVMVWFGQLGAATAPLGYANGSVDTREVDGASFDLFTGENQFGQFVLTWLGETNITAFDGDLMPLLQDLEGYNGPIGSDYLGYVAFGTETLYADQNATFSVPKLKMDVTTS